LVLSAFSVGQVAAFFALKERNTKAQGDAAQPRALGIGPPRNVPEL
jgi:hypothetical protein